MNELLDESVDLSQAKCATKSDAWEIFFPEGKDIPAKIRYAKAICSQCPVAIACFNKAMGMGADLNGVWAGTTQAERNNMRKNLDLRELHIKSLNN
jgi:hypothetical protein